MKKIASAIVSIAWALGLTSLASAADMAVKAPPVVLNDWSGFYLGGHGGYGWGRDPFQEALTDQPNLPNVAPATTPTGPLIPGVNSHGFVAGGYAGYNMQRRDWVGGLEVDFSAADIKGSNIATVTTSGQTAPIGQTATSTDTATIGDKFDILGSIRGRLGMLVSPNLLLYGTGGFGTTRLQQTFSNAYTLVSPPPGGAGTISSSIVSTSTTWRYGWVAGAGGEYKIFDGWLIRLEYLHYDFGSLGSQQPLAVAPTAIGARSSIKSFTSGDLTLDIARVGLAYRF